MQKSVEFSYINKELSEREIKKSISFTNSITKNKILRNKFNQGGKRSVHWKLQKFDEGNEEDTNGWNDIPYSWTGRMKIVKMSIVPEAT